MLCGASCIKKGNNTEKLTKKPCGRFNLFAPAGAGFVTLQKILWMATDIKCPKCGSAFPMEEAMAEEYKKDLHEQMVSYKKQKDEELRKQRDELTKKEREMMESLNRQESAFNKTLQEEKVKLREALEKDLRQSISGDFENRIRVLTDANMENDEKLRSARKNELEYLKKEQDLLRKEEELQITMQKELLRERAVLSEQIRKDEQTKTEIRETSYQLKLRELEKQLDDQKKLAEEMKRRAEQGSMQLQGEAQELLLEEILRQSFPHDEITEVGKGVEGADCILVVRNKQGREYGRIIFESKRAKGWNNVWVEKLRNDMRRKQADLAVLVTQVFPKNMDCFGEKDGVWICSFREVIGLTSALRTAVIRIAESRKTEENKGEKMQMLYDFLTGIEFRQQMEAIVEGFVFMQQSIIKEKMQMEKMWKERAKQLEKVLLSTSGMYGSIKGIAGASIGAIPLLEADPDTSVEEGDEE